MRKLLTLLFLSGLLVACDKLPEARDYTPEERAMLDMLHTEYATDGGNYKMRYHKYKHPRYVEIPKDIRCDEGVIRVFGTVDCIAIDENGNEGETVRHYFDVKPYMIANDFVNGYICIYKKMHDYYTDGSSPNFEIINLYPIGISYSDKSFFLDSYVNDEREQIPAGHSPCVYLVSCSIYKNNKDLDTYTYYYEFNAIK